MTFEETCPDCGAAAGVPHNRDCDVERCSVCFGQRLTCSCTEHEPLMSVWTGQWPKRKNTAESVRMFNDARVSARKRQCFYNAFSVVSYCDEFATATYVEGMAVIIGGLAIEHGWIETDESIIDPTLPTDKAIYFPGLLFEGQRGISQGLNISKGDGCHDLPIFYRFGWGGYESPDFRAARSAAMRLSDLFADRNQPTCESEYELEALTLQIKEGDVA